jgi:hypothetical protein
MPADFKRKILPAILILFGLILLSFTYVESKPYAGPRSFGSGSVDLAHVWRNDRVTGSAKYLVKRYPEAAILLGISSLGWGVWKYREK